jgi:hypothetical protein
LEHSESSSDLYDSDDEHRFVLSVDPKAKQTFRMPPSDVTQHLWETFVENFDPLTKIVHVPTLRPAFQRATSNTHAISRNFEALMFAIFGAAILTLKDDDCQQMFHESRRSILLKYTTATEAALSRAKFMATTSLVVLQALVIHIFSVRDIYEPRAVWTLTGVAVRIAQGIGLDRDGTVLGHSLFETEIRRRVWWQLKSHDFRAAELCGLAKFRDIATDGESTKWPSNINDNDLHPGISSLEVASFGLTDSTFLAFKFEMTNFAASRIAAFRKLGKGPSQWNLDTLDNDKVETESAIEALQGRLEMKYLRYCDPSQPLHLMLLLVGRYGMNVVTFLTHHPRRWATMEHVPSSERTLVWEGSIKLLEQYNMMQSNPLLKRFSWHAPYYQQWHAFIHVLDTLYAEPSRSDASKAWAIICSIYEHNPDLVTDMRKPIHVAIGNLCLKAYAARETVPPGSSTIGHHATPAYIMQLRQRREVAKAKQQARKEKSTLSGEHNISNTKLGPTPTISDQNQALRGYNSQQFTMPVSTSLDNLNGAIEDPYFYMFDENNNQSNDMYMDLDFVLPDDIMESYDPQQIDWEQWDTWLADSNIMRPSS